MTREAMPDPTRRPLERGLAAVVVGLVTAAVLIVALEPALRQLYPVPVVDPTSAPEQYRSTMDAQPPVTFILLWMLYAVGSLAGGIAASLTSGRTRSWPALATGGVLAVAGTFGVLTVYQPLWFRVVSFLAYPLAYVGHVAVRKR